MTIGHNRIGQVHFCDRRIFVPVAVGGVAWIYSYRCFPVEAGCARRELLGLEIGTSEAEQIWTEFLRRLARRGLRGIKLVVSDANEGIKAAVSKVLSATWQRLPGPLHAQRAGACGQEWKACRIRLHRPRICPGDAGGRKRQVEQSCRPGQAKSAETRQSYRSCRKRCASEKWRRFS